MANYIRMQISKAIMIVLLLFLVSTNCLKLSNKMKVETGTHIKSDDTTKEDSSTSSSIVHIVSQEKENVASISIPPSGSFNIIRSDDSNTDSEAEVIKSTYNQLQDLMRNSYKDLRNKISFSHAIVKIEDKGYKITVDPSGATASLSDLNSFLSLSSKYNDINGLFFSSIIAPNANKVRINSLTCYYFVDNKWSSKIADACFVQVSSSSGFYKIEASKLIPNTITMSTLHCYSKISSSLLNISNFEANLFGDELECKETSETGIVTFPDSFSKSVVNYSGNVNYDDGSKITDYNTEGMDNMLVPFTMITDNKFIENFDKDKPEFNWKVNPSKNQMTVDLLLKGLDQNLNDASAGITPPRGLSSINFLALISAKFHSVSGKFSNLEIECSVPTFDFLPLGLATSDNSCLIQYGSHTNVTVDISGIVSFDKYEVFESNFFKSNTTEEYIISLSGINDSSFSFQTIKNIVYPTISTDTGCVLPSDNLSSNKMDMLCISEDTSEITLPKIEIRFEPYLFYKVNGYISVCIDSDTEKDLPIQANFINLDGDVFAYMKLLSEDAKLSQKLFNTFFDVVSVDGGLKSIDINKLEVITTNRDFDMTQVSLLQNSYLDVDTREDIIAKMGVNVKVYASLINDCLDYTFCRVVKSNMVYSNLEFEGPVKITTVLSAGINDFTVPSGITFSHSTLQIVIDSDYQSNVKLSLIGDFVIIAEKDRAISLNTNWNFGSSPNENIKLNGRMLGIYNNVFKIGLIDLANVKVSGFLNSEGKIIDLNLNGLGIFGKNCYSSDNLVEALQSQDSKLTSEIFDLSDEKKNYDNSISVIKKTCKSSYFKIFLDSSDYKKNHIRGILNFENSEDILRTSLSIKSDDHIPEIINDIHFPYGLLLDYSYTDSTEDKPMSFKGIMNFMGVDSQGQFNLHSWNNTAKANIILPTIKMGNGNFEFITHDDLFYKYGLKDNSENFDSRSLDIHTGYSNLTSNNTLKFKLEKDSLSKSAILLEANMLIFGMVNRTITYLNKDLMSFSIIAHPFKGIFEANTTVEIKPTDHIENEDNSVVKIDFVHNDEYLNLEQTTNEYLQEWVSRIIKVTEKAKFLIEKYTQRLKTVSNSYTKENDCEVYEQCKELPTIVCDEYAQKATCVKEAVICTNMVQKCSLETNYCTRTNSKGECQQSILKCDKWETVCEDKAPSKVCSEFHTENIPDNCLKMELVCSTTKEKDQECVSKSKESEVLIQKIENDINDLVKFLSNAKQLRDSSVCALKNVKDKKSKKCSEKDVSIKEVIDNLPLLDLLDLDNVKANMQLNSVIAADKIVFNSDIWLYGDWTNKKLKYKDELVIKNNLNNEEEEEGYTNGAKSLISLNHYVNFNSIDLTAREIAKNIEMTICKEFRIDDLMSKQLQISIMEFNLLDGNSTICPHYEEIDISATSKGLYTEYVEKVSATIQRGTIESHYYNFNKGRKIINISEEEIKNRNTLSYEQKINSLHESSPIEVITNNIDSKPVSSAIPVGDAINEFKINSDDKDTGASFKDKNSQFTDTAIKEVQNQSEYSQKVKQKQDEIDQAKIKAKEEKRIRRQQERKKSQQEKERMIKEKQEAESHKNEKEVVTQRLLNV